MRKCIPGFLLLFSHALHAQKLTTRFEKTNGKESAPYTEAIEFYKQLDRISPQVLVKEMGQTDAGYPLHLVLFSKDGKFDPVAWHRQGKVVIMINNGIHPGEPDGIDASMMLLRDLHTGKTQIPANVVLGVIPVYNIGGALNRSKFYRVDQNGPEEFGFRGNSQNLDLNRDFIKSDSKEAKVFATIFHYLDPDILIDNHVSDGADYQHVMTLISTQHNKLGGKLGDYLKTVLEPGLYGLMKERGYDIVPYVNSFGDSPESGWPEFYDAPRYSSGYGALWHCFSFIPETHMLKPYSQRVMATYALMESFISFSGKNSKEIIAVRTESRQASLTQSEFPISWKLDRSKFSEINFKGYEAARKPSNISGQPRLYYDRDKPFEKKVQFYNFYEDGLMIKKPSAYLVPQGWWRMVDLLKANQVKMRTLSRDTTIEVEVYHIDDYKSSARQYEMHHPNNDVKLSVAVRKVNFRKGDYYIEMNQNANRFLMEVLEPQAGDSYFAWNFFDAILGQKEDYSHYVFEETAEKYLAEHPEVKAQLDEKKSADSAFAKNGAAQLNFVYEHSPYFEPDYLTYPVYRVVK